METDFGEVVCFGLPASGKLTLLKALLTMQIGQIEGM